jgi:hypothetical protein
MLKRYHCSSNQETDMSTQFCDRYRERNVSNPREMLALRGTPVDLKKWQPVSYGRTPSSKVTILAAQGYVIIEYAADLLKRAARSYRKGIGRHGPTDVSAVFRSHG